MNINLALNGLSTTIEGNPVNIDRIEISCDVSSQDIATGGGLFTTLGRELKPLLKEVKPEATPGNNNYNKSDNNKNINNKNNNNYNNYNKSDNNKNINNKNNNNYNNYNKNKSLQEAFNSIPVPEKLEEKGYKTRRYETGSYSTNDRLSVTVDNAKYGVIHINIMTPFDQVHIHVYPENTRINGCSPENLISFLKYTCMPEEIQEYIKRIITL